MELDPVNISPLPAGMMLSFANRGAPGGHCRRKRLSLGSHVLHFQFLQLMGAPVPAFQCGWLSSRQRLTASPTQLRHFSVYKFPSTPESKFQQVLLAQHLSQLTHHPGATAPSSQQGGRAPSWVHCLQPRGTGHSSHLPFLHSLQSHLATANFSLLQSPGIVNNSPY